MCQFIDDVFYQYYVQDDVKRTEWVANRSDSILKLRGRSSNDEYTITVLNDFHLDMVVENVATGMPFRKVAKLVHLIRKVNHLSQLECAWEGTVRIYIQ